MNEPVRVLVVDDNPSQLRAASHVLRSDGMEVDEASSGREALELMATRPPSLLLIDAVLPDVHGTEVVRRVREERRFDDMAIMLVSALEISPEDRAAGLDAGADGYIARPIGRRDFVSQVRAQLRQRELARRLRASEERIRRLIHSQSDAVVVVNAGGFIRMANAAAARLLGRGGEALEGTRCPLEVRPRDGAETVSMSAMDGSEVILEIRASETEWDDEPAVIASLRDVTAREQALASLRESERRYREIVDQSPDLIFVNRNGRIRYVNPAGVRMLRASSAGDLIGRSPFEIIHPDHHELVRRRIAEILARPGLAPLVDNRMIALDGTIIDVEVMAVSFQSGEHLDIQVICRDVTERRRAEERERALAQRLATTLESLADGFFTLDHDWRFTFVSREAGRLLGRESGGLIGRSYWDAFPDNAGTAFERGYREALRDHRLVEFEGHCSPTDRWFNVRANPIPGGLAVTLRDVTERRLLQARLEEQAALLDAAREVIFVQDLDGRIRYWNRAAELLHGRSAADAVERGAAEVLGPADPLSPEARAAVLSSGSWQGVHRYRDAQGEERHVETSLTLVGSAGSASAILAICSDVTDRKLLEAQLLRAQRMESIGTLAGGIAHDLNNVLTPVLMAVDLLREDIPRESRLEMLASVESSVQRGARMVKQLLSFARGASEDAASVDARLIAKEVVRVVRDTFPKGIRIEFSEGTSQMLLLADPTQVHQVIMNLVVNARDAMPDGGRLAIRISEERLDDTFASMHPDSRPGPHVVLEVADTGTGIAPEHLDRIFDPFFTTKPPGQGTGLGLATVHSIVRGLGGFVRVSSERDKGTRFRVYLPAQESAMGTQPHGTARASIPRGNGQLVLIVDDEPSVRDIARRTLEQHGYRVLLAEHGAEAVSRLATNKGSVAAVMTDMSMPVMDGPATIVAVRSLDPDVPIIASSGLATEAMMARAASLGVTNFVAKPYTAEALLAELHAVLGERPRAPRRPPET